MNPLSSKRRSALRAEAHKLSPIVIIGDKGLTDEVLAEVDRALKAHELIKVRAATDDRDARNVWMESICEKLEAHPVQQIGKVLVVFRENPKEAKPGRKWIPGRCRLAAAPGMTPTSAAPGMTQTSAAPGMRERSAAAGMTTAGRKRPPRASAARATTSNVLHVHDLELLHPPGVRPRRRRPRLPDERLGDRATSRRSCRA
jgi:putative RNA-binding protein, YhbY family